MLRRTRAVLSSTECSSAISSRSVIDFRTIYPFTEKSESAASTMASGVTRVIERCDRAIETGHLDLNECQLTQMPEAVFHLLRNTEVLTLDISRNVILRIPAKLPTKFPLLTGSKVQLCGGTNRSVVELRLSGNRVGLLPPEIGSFAELTLLDVSRNALVSLPLSVYGLSKLKTLNASHNYIAEVEVEDIRSMKCLESLSLEENPLRDDVLESLRTSLPPSISLTISSEQQ